jgi:MFS family permease
MALLQDPIEESNPRYEGWRVVAGTGVGVFLVSSFFFTFPVFLKPLSEAFSWSREAVSAAYAAMTLASAFTAPFIGHLVDRSGPRWVSGPCLTVAGCSFASLALLTPLLWHLYAVFALIGLATTGASYIVYSRVIATWFDARRGMALAVMIASSGAGGMVFPPVAQALIDLVGWRSAYLAVGIVSPVLGLPMIVWFVRERATGAPESRHADARSALERAMRSRILWTLLVVVFGTTMAVNATMVHLSALLTDRGVSAGTAALVVSVMGTSSVAGRLLTGWLLDRFAATRVSFVLLVSAASGVFLLAGAHTTSTGIAAAALIGFGTGGEIDAVPYLLSRYFGLSGLSSLMGLTWMAFGLAGAVGPVVMGRAYDATGSYELVLRFAAAATVGIAVLVLTLPIYPRAATTVAEQTVV